MCTSAEIAAAARMKLRDFPQFFEVPYTAAPIYTLRCPHPNVDPSSIQMWQPDGTLVDNTGNAAFTIDGRNGIIKFKDPTQFPNGVGVTGYFYEWFMPDDLIYAAGVVSHQHMYDRDVADDGSDFAAVECDVIATGAVMQALWSLMAELAVDIDVSTPEGMNIPASQRFRQMWELAGLYTQTYRTEAAMLGVGLDRFEQFTLRRIAYLTNRLVPLLREREVDNPNPPQRVLPPIPDGLQNGDGDLVYMPEPPGGLGYGGWQTFGTSG
jgi:hypothetical protein